MECASILLRGVKDLQAFGCRQKASCFYVPKCVYQPNSSQTMGGNSLWLLYVSSGETLVQRASWNLTSLALGECLYAKHLSSNIFWYRKLKVLKLY